MNKITRAFPRSAVGLFAAIFAKRKGFTLLSLTRIIFLIGILFFFFENSFSQKLPYLIPYRKGNLWGYCDSTKKIIIEPIYHETNLFSEDVAQILLNDSVSGFINKKGKLLFSLKGTGSSEFYHGLLEDINSEDKIGFLDKEGKVAIPYQFEHFDMLVGFQYGYSPVVKKKINMKDTSYIYEIIDTLGNVLLESKGDVFNLCSVNETFAFIFYGDKTQIFDVKKKKFILEYNDSIPVNKIREELKNTGYKESEINNEMLENKNYRIYWSYTLTKSFPNDALYLYNVSIKKTKKTYKSIELCEDLLQIAADYNNNVGCVDKNGIEIISPSYSMISYKGKGLYAAYTKREKLHGYIDRYGKKYWEEK